MYRVSIKGRISVGTNAPARNARRYGWEFILNLPFIGPLSPAVLEVIEKHRNPRRKERKQCHKAGGQGPVEPGHAHLRRRAASFGAHSVQHGWPQIARRAAIISH